MTSGVGKAGQRRERHDEERLPSPSRVQPQEDPRLGDDGDAARRHVPDCRADVAGSGRSHRHQHARARRERPAQGAGVDECGGTPRREDGAPVTHRSASSLLLNADNPRDVYALTERTLHPITAAASASDMSA